MTSTETMDTLVAEYVAGSLCPPAHALVDAHLELSDQNHQWVNHLEGIAGSALSEASPSSMDDADDMLAHIFASVPVDADEKNADKSRDTAWMPKSLKDFVETDPDQIPWKMKIPGVRTHKLASDDDCEVYFLRIKPGMKIPTHTHDGRELTLVLQGAFDDGAGHYGVGDVAIAEEGMDHKPVAAEGEDCICFVVNDAPLRFKGTMARIVNSLLPK